MNTVEIVFPADTNEGTQSFLSKWFKRIGDSVSLHEPIAEISTDKVIVEIASPAAGVVSELSVKENDEISPGQVLGRISLSIEGDRPPLPPPPSSGPSRGGAVTSSAHQDVSPAVRKLVREHQIDISLVSGTGGGGRITVEDVERYLTLRGSQSGGTGRRVPLNAMRKAIAKNLSDSLLRVAPHVTTVFEVDMTAVFAHKKGSPHKLTLTSYILKAMCEAVRVVPEVNSRLSDEYLEIFDDVHIGVGVATDDGGLVVPVIKDAQGKGVVELSEALFTLTERVRRGELSREEVTGATLSLSNYGMTGGLFATPIIIPQPQSAIVGVGTVEKRPRVLENDSIEVRPVCYVTLTLDHRVLDGFAANRFMSELKRVLEAWS